MPKRNIERLTQIRDLIIAEPAKLEMNSWSTVNANDLTFNDDGYAKVSCGTTQCIAGWAVVLHGYVMLYGIDQQDADGGYFAVNCQARNGRVMDIEWKATEILGLTEDEANFLFLDVENSTAVNALNLFIAGKSLQDIKDQYDEILMEEG